MAITYDKKLAVFQEAISIEEADGLMEWLIKTPKSKIDLTQCQHLHAAILQVLMAAKPVISAWPQDENLQAWLASALNHNNGE